MEFKIKHQEIFKLLLADSERERERERERESSQRGKEVIEFCKENPWSNNAPFTGASADRTRPTFGTAGVRPALVRQQVEKSIAFFSFFFSLFCFLFFVIYFLIFF
jgi:SOS response regulatory protein OraA/RecX